MNDIQPESDKTVLGKLEAIKHIHRVRALLSTIIAELDERARLHDQTKLLSPEKEIYGEFTPELAKCEYGSKEYFELLEKVKPAIEHHYAHNRHHPEYHKNGINDMDLIDLIEMLMDWLAATERMKNGNIRISISKNAIRFKFDEVKLEKILDNTITRYF